MSIVEIILISLGLAMDSFAMSITSGLILKKISIKDVLKIAFYMGVFQALMPVIGWFAGKGMQQYIESFDHWVAFGLLVFLGGKMIFDYFKAEDEKQFNPRKHIVLIGLAVATSIDALVIGVNFAFLEVDILFSIVSIGLTAFSLSFIGVYIGNKFGKRFDFKAELVGGIILVGIGVKILIEHVFFIHQ